MAADQKKSKFLYWAPTIFYMALIFYVSSQPLQLPQIKQGMDKVVHLLEYAVLAHLLQYSFRRTTQLSFSTVRAASALIAAVYGISDELHQLYVPNRSCDAVDALSDILGSLTVFLKIF